MKRTLTLVLQGLGTALPIGLTLYAVIWLITTIEVFTRDLLLVIIPIALYLPGLGLLTAMGALFAVGLLMNLYGLRYLVDLTDRLLQKIPLAKSIYASIKDIISVFKLGSGSELQTVVGVDMGNGIQQIGFVTGELAGKKLFPDSGKIGVYLPMSYQIGGFTMYMDKDRLTPLNISVEEAMRLTLTGGVQAPDSKPRKAV